MKMNVDFSVMSDLAKHGTVGFRTYLPAKECLEKGYLNKILCRSSSAKDIPGKYLITFPFYKLIALGLTAIRMYLFPKLPTYKVLHPLFDRLTARHVKNCDIFHTWDVLPHTLKKAKKIGAKTIVDIHMNPINYTNGKITFPKKNKYVELDKYIDYFFVPSDFGIEVCEKIGLKKCKLIKIPFGVDTNKFVPPNKKTNRKFKCLFVGGLNPRKGLPYLLKAWEKANLENSELVICGRAYIQGSDILKDYKKIDNIIFKGNLDEKDLIKQYQGSSVFILPSLIEGSAKSTYEAMACGLPIITTPNTGSVARDGEEGFIVPAQDSEALREKIQYLYENPDKLKQMSISARKLSEKYTWQNYSQRILKAYKKIHG